MQQENKKLQEANARLKQILKKAMFRNVCASERFARIHYKQFSTI